MTASVSEEAADKSIESPAALPAESVAQSGHLLLSRCRSAAPAVRVEFP